ERPRRALGQGCRGAAPRGLIGAPLEGGTRWFRGGERGAARRGVPPGGGGTSRRSYPNSPFELLEGYILVHAHFARHAEDAFGNLVAQHFVGAACDPHHGRVDIVVLDVARRRIVRLRGNASKAA